MPTSRLLLLLPFALSACTGPAAGPWPAWSWPWPPSHQGGGGPAVPSGAGSAAYARFDFDWQLSGDPEIMPVQVFDDGERMWLQFMPEGAWPAVFAVGAGGWRPLTYRREGPYMVLEGVHGQLELRGGHLRGAIRRAHHDPGPAEGGAGSPGGGSRPPAQPMPVAGPAAGAEGAATALSVPGSGVVPLAGSGAAAPVPGLSVESLQHGVAVRANPVSPEAVPSAAILGPGAQAAASGGPVVPFSVSPADVTMRQALERWAAAAGWMFSSEHWAVDVDIPLVGRASFETDFKSAVRELLAATEMGDRPLQPCFYSNHVLRIVPHAQACDRRSGMGAMS